MKHVVLAVCWLSLTAAACADRLYQIPVGKKIPLRTARLDYLFDAGERATTQYALGLGVNENIDIEFFSTRFGRDDHAFTFDLSYNFLTPITDLGPGLSVGIRDVLANSEQGRFAYVAATQRVGLSGTYNQDVPLEFTIGFANGRTNKFFAGVMIPFAESVRYLTEYRSRGVMHGLEIRPTRRLGIRVLSQDETLRWSLSWTQKF